MKIGLLWFDNDSKRSLEEKVNAGAARYQEKFGTKPNACYVNPVMLEGKGVYVNGLKVMTADNVLPHHFFIGVQEPGS